MREEESVYTSWLQCVECGRVSREGERGWTARLTIDDEATPPPSSDSNRTRMNARFFRSGERSCSRGAPAVNPKRIAALRRG